MNTKNIQAQRLIDLYIYLYIEVRKRPIINNKIYDYDDELQ